MNGNYYFYMRISTKEERNKQTYNRQIKPLMSYAEQNDIDMNYVIIFKEDCSGKNFTDRKEWNKLERIVKAGDIIVFKDIARFTREAINGYDKYMKLFNMGVKLIFLDNMTISTPYIEKLLDTAKQQENLVAKTTMELLIKLLLIVELDRAEQERKIFIQRVKDGIKASPKASGRPKGKLDKMSPELEKDIKLYLTDRSIKQVDLMKKHNISRNTLKKYAEIIRNR